MTPPRLPAGIHEQIDGTGLAAVPPIFGYVTTSGEAAAVSARTCGDVRRMTPPGAGGHSGFALFASPRAGVRVVESAADRAVIEAVLASSGKPRATCRGTFVAVRPGHPAYHQW